MKKWLSYVLVLGLLLACAGCSKQDSETATDVSSVASQTANASVVEESSVPQNQEEEKPEESSPVESAPSQPEEESQEDSRHKEEEPDTPEKIDLTWKQQGKNNRVKIDENNDFSVAVCNAYKEFETSLKVKPSDTRYTKEYFESGSLVLVTFSTANTAINFHVHDLYLENGTLYMVWVKTSGGVPKDVCETWQYFVEVKETLTDIGVVHCKVHNDSFGFEGEQYIYDIKKQTTQTFLLEEEFIPCDDTVDDDFVVGEIWVGIKKKYSKVNKVWTAADFPQLKGITKIEEIVIHSQTEDFHQLLIIYISGKTKQDVIDGIAALSQNEKVLYAEPNSIISEA